VAHGSARGSGYDWAVEREPVTRVLGQLVWGTDTAAFHRDIARLADQPDGTAILDSPCGGGVAFRGLRVWPRHTRGVRAV